MTDCAGQRADSPQHDSGEPYWCPRCKASIRRKLTDLDYQLAWLAFRADGFHEQPESPSRHSGHHPSPSPAMDEIERLTGEIFEWEHIYRVDILHIGAAFHTGPLNEVRSKVIAWLAENLDGILGSDIGPDFGREVIQRHRELLGQNKALPPRRGLAPCPACGMKLLAWIDGYDGLVCGGCNRHVTKDEYEAEVNAARRHLEQAG